MTIHADDGLPVVSVLSAAKLAGRSRESIYEYIRSGKLDAYRSAGTYLIRRVDLLKMIDDAPHRMEKLAA